MCKNESDIYRIYPFLFCRFGFALKFGVTGLKVYGSSILWCIWNESKQWEGCHRDMVSVKEMDTDDIHVYIVGKKFCNFGSFFCIQVLFDKGFTRKGKIFLPREQFLSFESVTQLKREAKHSWKSGLLCKFIHPPWICLLFYFISQPKQIRVIQKSAGWN